jgi:hypothetical protein
VDGWCGGRFEKVGDSKMAMVARDIQYWKTVLMEAETHCGLKCY